ncbi:MAG: hypothetical protein RIE32_12705 [Phycisphaerales bacterium]
MADPSTPAPSAPPVTPGPIGARGRRHVWIALAVIAVVIMAAVAWMLLSVRARDRQMMMPGDTSMHLNNMGATIRAAMLDGASFEDALAVARAEGWDVERTKWGSKILYNPNSEAWTRDPTILEPRVILLMTHDVFNEVPFSSNDRQPGERGRYGWTNGYQMEFITDDELPDWARP